MTIPSLPTDNLYKFLALAGVAIVIAAGAIYFDKSQDLKKDEEALTQEIVTLTGEQKSLNADLTALLNKTEDLIKSFYPAAIAEDSVKLDSARKADLIKVDNNKLNSTAYMMVLESLPEKYLKLSEKLHFANLRRLEELDKIQRQLDRKSEFQDLKVSQQVRKRRELRELTNAIIGSGIFGLLLASFGFLQWYFKIQVLNDETLQLELKRLKEGKK